MFADASGARGFEFLPERDFVEVIQYSNESFKALTFGFSRIRHSTYPKHSTLQLFLAQTQNFAICLWRFVGLWSKVKRGSVALKPMTRWKVASFNIRMQTQEMDPKWQLGCSKGCLSGRTGEEQLSNYWDAGDRMVGIFFLAVPVPRLGFSRVTMFKSFKFGQVSPLCCLNLANFTSVSDNSFHSGIYFQIPVF